MIARSCKLAEKKGGKGVTLFAILKIGEDIVSDIRQLIR